VATRNIRPSPQTPRMWTWMTTETKKEKKDLKMKASTTMAQDRKRRNHKGFTVPNTRHAISASPGVSILLGTSGTVYLFSAGLARTDICRKHTGERPFQCHCSRRFSRLDNLRQHAQTVHQNEEIPQDSLAATGTRFQRQVRTDRVRPPGSRSRASTAGSAPGVRGHHRNSLSASSIGSVASTYSQNADVRRRPPL